LHIVTNSTLGKEFEVRLGNHLINKIENLPLD
jgi:hypothetical protein